VNLAVNEFIHKTRACLLDERNHPTDLPWRKSGTHKFPIASVLRRILIHEHSPTSNEFFIRARFFNRRTFEGVRIQLPVAIGSYDIVESGHHPVAGAIGLVMPSNRLVVTKPSEILARHSFEIEIRINEIEAVHP
jgi:hypothetical protein